MRKNMITGCSSLFRMGGVFILVLGAFFSCTRDGGPGSWTSENGITLSWHPAKPLIGDLVELDARIPGTLWSQEHESLVLKDGGGKEILPQVTDFEASQVRVRYQFRVRSTGNWTWGKDSESLWSVEARISGQAEPKAMDPAGLWKLETKAVPHSEAGNPAGSGSSGGQGSMAPLLPPGASPPQADPQDGGAPSASVPGGSI